MLTAPGGVAVLGRRFGGTSGAAEAGRLAWLWMEVMVVHSRGSVLVWCLTGTVESNMRSNMVVGSVTTRLGAVTAAVTALVDAVQDGALRGEGHDELSGLLGQVRGLQARLDYVALTAVREVDIRGSYVADGALSAGAWARMHTRMTPGEAAGVVRTAAHPGVGGAARHRSRPWPTGVIDLGHVKAITAAVADAPAGAAALIEAEALAVAGEADPRAVAALMTRFRHALDPDAADAAALARYARRGITLSPLPDGAVHIKGLADEVTGAVLMTAIDAANPPVTGDTRTAAQQRMDALADICRKYLGSPHAPMTGGGHAHLIVALDAHHPDQRTHPSRQRHDQRHDQRQRQCHDQRQRRRWRQRHRRRARWRPLHRDSDMRRSRQRATHDSDDHDSDDHDSDRDCAGQADAVGVGGAVLDWGVGLAERPPVGNGVAGNGAAGDATTGNGAAGIATTGNDATGTGMSLGAVAGQGYGAGPGGTLSWVGPIAGSTARRVGCDADVTYVGINDQGQATIVGREQRFFSWAQRKAMIARDGDRCAVPFCDRPIAWADAHHLLDWALGGPTRISNGALPCAGHHPMCHEGGWTLIRLPDGRYLFRHRDGKTIGPEPYPPGHNRPPPHNKPPHTTNHAETAKPWPRRGRQAMAEPRPPRHD